jgi:hypothetical protein
MTEERKSGGRSERIAERAVWTAPDGSATVTYSLPLFHEIDFAVNEGYRKISHGGVEVGGLLFGSLDKDGARIEAFRPIACDHASGPSFLLSESDLERLVVQLDTAPSDPELAPWKPIGWFLSRTRSPLQLMEREIVLFDYFFPEPGMLTVMIKPERFQPTRFTFLIRDREGKVARDAGPPPIILPLPGRGTSSASADQPVPAIPAPIVNSAAPQPVESPNLPETNPAEAPTDPQLWDKLDVTQVPLAFNGGSDAGEAPSPSAVEEEPEPEPERLSQLTVAPSPVALAPTTKPARPAQQSSARPSAPPRTSPELPDPYERLDLHTKKKPPSTGLRLFLVLPLAALLGCAVGYWGYLQLPSPIIPLQVRGLSRSILVSWPPEDTRNAVYAAIRVNDATPLLLSSEEKAAGQVELSASPDIKVELIARNWMRNSRGIIRFVKAENVSGRSTIP